MFVIINYKLQLAYTVPTHSSISSSPLRLWRLDLALSPPPATHCHFKDCTAPLPAPHPSALRRFAPPSGPSVHPSTPLIIPPPAIPGSATARSDTQIATIRSTVLIQSTRVTDRQTDRTRGRVREGPSFQMSTLSTHIAISRCAL